MNTISTPADPAPDGLLVRWPAGWSLGILLVLLVGGACSRSKPTTPGDTAGRPPARALVYGSTDSVGTLIPYRASRDVDRHLQELLFDGLVNKRRVTPDGRQEFYWALARDYVERSATDRKAVVVPLNPSARWHDGREVTAEDVVFSWNALQESQAPQAGWLREFIAELRANEKFELQLTLHCERSQEVVMELLSSFKILPRSVRTPQGQTEPLPNDLRSGGPADDFAYRPIGSGPYQLKDKLRPTELELTATDYFLGPPAIKTIRFRQMEDAGLLVKGLLGGEIDLLLDVRAEALASLKGKPVRIQSYEPYHFHAIFYNRERPPFDQLPLRQALNLATNKLELAAHLRPGEDVAPYINSSVFPHNYVQVEADREQAFASATGYDKIKAAGALAALGAAPRFTLLISSELDGLAARKLAERYRSLLQEAGVTVEIRDEGVSKYLNMLRPAGEDPASRGAPEYEAALVVVRGLDHFYDLRSLFFAPPDGRRGSGLPALLEPVRRDRPPLEAALVAFGKTIAFEELRELTRTIHREVETAAPACFLFTLPRDAAHSEALRRVTIHPEVGFGDVRLWSLDPAAAALPATP